MRNVVLAGLATTVLLVSSCSNDGAGNEAADTSSSRTATTPAPETTAARRAPSKPLTNAERRWVRRYAAWRDSLVDAVATIDEIRTTWLLTLFDSTYENRPVGRYVRTLGRVDRCAAALAKDVGNPPGERLDEVYDLLEEGCELIERAAASDRDAVEAKDTDAFEAAQGDWDEGIIRHEKADDLVVQSLMYSRNLRVKRGRTTVSRVEPVFGDAVSRAVSENVRVRCWSKRDWALVLKDRSAYVNGRIEDDLLGFANAGEPAQLAPDVCEQLVALRYERERPEGGEALLKLADAVVVLTHEAEHVRGETNEAATECYAMQRARETAQFLGASRRYADRLVDAFWEEVYPYNLRAYRTEDCRDGGPLDLHPERALWP